MPIRFLFAAAAFVVLPVQARTPASVSAQASVDALIAADRDFAGRADRTDLVSALTATFDEQIVLPLPGGKFARGRAAAADFIRGNAENATSKIAWQPVRGGVSADGMQGFTFGFMTVTWASGTLLPMKYLSYWIRRPGGWQVIAYRRAGRPEGKVSLEMRSPALPVAAHGSPPADPDNRTSLIAAEQAFSDEAQRVGIAAAFTNNGRADAMNMGSEADFTFTAAAIGNSLGESNNTSPVRWASDDAIVASSGDLGISWGRIFSNTEPDRVPVAFFTVWKREPGGPWRYIAE